MWQNVLRIEGCVVTQIKDLLAGSFSCIILQYFSRGNAVLPQQGQYTALTYKIRECRTSEALASVTSIAVTIVSNTDEILPLQQDGLHN
jgi:hypothetical protein